MGKVNIKKNIAPILFAIAIVIGIIILCPKPMQNDTFWSIKIGEKLVKDGTWEIDPFSMHDGLKYVAHHFFTDVVIYFVYVLGGFTGLYILEILMALGLAWILYLLNKELCGSKKLSYSMLCMQMVLLTLFISVRAQMISYMLFALELLLLEKSRKQDKLKYYIGLGIIPLLLTNFHMGVAPFYFILLGVYGLDALNIKFLWLKTNTKPDSKRFKKLILLGIIGILLLFVNPYGIDGVVYCFKTLGNDFINTYIDEFQPFSMRDSITMLHVLYIIFVLFVFMVSKAKVDLKDMLLIFGTLFMHFTAYRYTSLFIICSAVIVKYILSIIKTMELEKVDKIAFVVTSIMIMIVLGVDILSTRNLDYLEDAVAPVKAVEVLKENIDEDTILYNEYIWGGYLILNDVKVFIDSRADLYTEEYNDGVTVAKDFAKIQMLQEGYKEAMEKYNFNMYLVHSNSLTSRMLDDKAEFKCIYTDDAASIYKKVK
ncbi:MAG: hypothetical protein IKK84_04230 [Clostridia bacterium]|nr:hypothetical protein [Clostridia bacterium]